MGLLDTGAFILSNRGMQMEHIAVVSVLSSLYGAVTVALAAIFLRERISRWQLAGIVTIFEGILLIST
jgi:drug/metabolite transporter (DMT)-like permease